MNKVFKEPETCLDWFNNLKSPILACLSPKEWRLFRDKSYIKVFESGASIIERDATETSVYFIIEGYAHVLNYSASGRAVTFSSLSSGAIFGEMSAIDGLPRAAWVLAINECRVIEVPQKVFMEFVKNNHKFAITLLQKISMNLRESNDRLTDVFSLGAEQRACIELIRMAKPDPLKPNCYLVTEMPTQAFFATLIGSSRETVSRIMSRLKNESIIINSANGLQILDRKQLEKRAFD